MLILTAVGDPFPRQLLVIMKLYLPCPCTALTLLLGWSFSAAVSDSCLAQSAIATNESSVQVESDDAKTSFLDEIMAYDIALNDPSVVLTLRENPVMSWTNPVQQDQHGAVFVWMGAGRPQAVGCCFHFGTGDALARVHEFHTLATAPLTARLGQKVIWQPGRGLAFSALQTPVPAASPQARIIQMRQISRRFTAQKIRDNGDRTELRLISRPVLNYQPKSDPCIEGAMFSFAAGGTDPDAFLLIENRTVGGRPMWHYCFARFHFNELKAQLDGNDVWSAKAEPGLMRNYLGSKPFRNHEYITFRTY